MIDGETPHRISPSRHDALPKRAVSVAHATYLVIGLGGNLVGPAIPALRVLLRQDYGSLALIFPASAVGSVFSLIFGNRILDRFGYRATLASGAVLYCASLIALGLSRSLSLWLVELFFAGLAGSFLDVAGARFVNVVHAEGRNRALNLLNLFYALGSLLAPAAVFLMVLRHGAVADLFLLLGLLSGALSVSILWTFQQTTQYDRASVSPTLWDGWRWAVGQRWLLMLSGCIGLYVGAEVGLSGWVSAYAHASAGVPVAQAALFPLVFWAAMALGRILAVDRARLWTEETLLWVGIAVSLGGTTLLVAPDPAALLVLGCALAGLGFGPIFPTLVSLASRNAPRHASEAFAFLFPAGAAGNFVLPLLSGELFARLSPTFAMLVPALAILGVGALLRHPELRAGRSASRETAASPPDP